LLDYHLRVGQLTQDTRIPAGYSLSEQRLDETETGEATTVTLIDAKFPADLSQDSSPDELARHLGLEKTAKGLVSWDVFDAVLTPGDLVLLMSFKVHADAETFEKAVQLPGDGRLRHIRVVRDYGKYDRRESPQYYPDVAPQSA
jgi:hypothetical protein